jgi:hypothetical protein
MRARNEVFHWAAGGRLDEVWVTRLSQTGWRFDFLLFFFLTCRLAQTKIRITQVLTVVFPSSLILPIEKALPGGAD